MKKYKVSRRGTFLLAAFVVLFTGGSVYSDIQRSVIQLLTSLSRQYKESQDELFFRRPLAVVPFINKSPLADKHNIGSVVEELIRKEVAQSTIFDLTEKKNLDRILQEIEFSLTDLASADSAVRVGNLTGASFFLAGSVTESGEEFLLNARLIEVETAIVVAAESVPIPKGELIGEAMSGKYSYVAQYGLGIYTQVGAEIPLTGTPWAAQLEDYPLQLAFAFGFSYRPLATLQLLGGFHVTWTEHQFGEFDPTKKNYDNASLPKAYAKVAYDDPYLMHYGVEFNQNYLALQGLYVWNPIQKLSLSFGGGGLIGLWTSMTKLGLPIYVGEFGAENKPLEKDNPANYLHNDVIIVGGNGLLYGLLATLKLDYFISPRVLLFADVHYRKTFTRPPVRYTYGGVNLDSSGINPSLSNWEPEKTPFGDSLSFGSHDLGLALGLSLAF